MWSKKIINELRERKLLKLGSQNLWSLFQDETQADYLRGQSFKDLIHVLKMV